MRGRVPWRQVACTRCETWRASRAATVAAASGGGAVVGGGEHARKNQFNYLVLRSEPRKFFLVCMWLGLGINFASSDFIVSLSYSTASKMVRTRVTFENPPADPRPARRALRARALRRRRAELRRCEIFAWPLARTDERPAAANDRRSPRRALSAGPDTHTRDIKPYCEERALYDRRARIAGEGEDAHQPRGDRPRRRR